MCPKGQHCSFLHVLNNPSGQYSVEKTILEVPSVRKSQRNAAQNKVDDNDR